MRTPLARTRSARFVAALLACAALLLPAPPAAGFSYFQYGGYSIIWITSQADRYLSTMTFVEGDDADTLILAAMGQWSSVWGSNFTYAYGYVSEANTVIDPNDGYSITVAVPSDMLDPGVLGVTYMVNYADIWYDMDLVFSDFPEGVGWHMLPDPDCEITRNPAPLNGFSFYLVALHELGHAIGLGHDPIGNEPAGTAWRIGTMNPSYPAGGPVGNQNIVELHTDDRRGTRFLYPGTAPSRVDLANSGYISQGPKLGKAVPAFFTPSTITPGEELVLWAMIENFGTVPVAGVRDRFFLSTDPVIDAGDFVLGSLTFDVVLNARMEFAAATDIPDLPAGTYYIGSILDDNKQVAEVYEDNNQADYCDLLIIAQAVPQFAPFSQQIITCDQPYTGPTPVVAFPVNMAPITWSLDNAPPGMTVDPATGVISWPEPIKSPFVYEIVLRATNGAGSSTQVLRLGVQQAAPQIAPIANHATTCGSSYTGPTPMLTAPACAAPILQWSLVSGPPDMTINPNSGVVTWPEVVPGDGPHVVTIRAINAIGEATETWLLHVEPAGGDLDGNGVVDAADMAEFSPCVGGPGVPPSSACRCADFDQDGDVDLADYARMMVAATGETIAEGACCFGDGNCAISSPESCYTLGGYFQGDGTDCAEVSCSGACCFFTGGCLDFTVDFCSVAGGTFQGMGSACAELSCPAAGTGACCWPNETCSVVTPSACAAGGGTSHGVGMSCAVVDCTLPVGACCQVDGACTVGTSHECTLTGGTFMGAATTCSANVCDGVCCYPSGACLDLDASECEISAGQFAGPMTSCAAYTCTVQPVGACCAVDDSCTIDTQSRCNTLGGSYQGDATTCAAAHCEIHGGCCLPDESCAVLTPAACGLQGGIYLGDGIDCAGANCSLDELGACYVPADWTCSDTGAGICAALGGVFEGVGTSCATTLAPEYGNTIEIPSTFYSPGANLGMADDLTLRDTARGLIYYDLGVAGLSGGTFNVTVSLYTDCPGAGGILIPGTQQTWSGVPADGYVYILSADFSAGPIRLPDAVWMVASFSSADAGWVLAEQAEFGMTEDLYAEQHPTWECDYWFGGPPSEHAGFWANIECVVLPEPQGACCHSGACSIETESACALLGGQFMGENTDCGETDCTSVNVGACCDTATWSCTLLSAADCAALGASFDGLGTSCTGACPEYLNEINPVSLSYNAGAPIADDLVLAGTARDLSYFSIAVYGGGGGPFDVSAAFYDKSPCAGGAVIPGTLVSGSELPDGQLLNLNVTLPVPVRLPTNPWLVVEFSNPYAGWIVAEQAEAGSTANVFAVAAYDGQQWGWSCNQTVPDAYAGFWAEIQCIDAAKTTRTAGDILQFEVTPLPTPAGGVQLLRPAERAAQNQPLPLLPVQPAPMVRQRVERHAPGGALSSTAHCTAAAPIGRLERKVP